MQGQADIATADHKPRLNSSHNDSKMISSHSDSNSKAAEEPALCYICYDEEDTTTNPFVREEDNVCDCRGSMKVHQMCYEMARGLGEKCKTCRSVMRRPTAADDRWDAIVNYGEKEKTFIMKKACGSDVRHGPSVEMEAASGGTGMFYIKKKFNFIDGELSGPYTTHDESGEVTGEGTYLRGQKHGRCEEKLQINMISTFAKVHAMWVDHYRQTKQIAYIVNLKLGGEFSSGKKTGVHVSVVKWEEYNPYDCIQEATYKDDLKNGPERHYLAHQYDEKMTVVDVAKANIFTPTKMTCRELEWRAGEQHGWERKYDTTHNTHDLVLEQHWRDGVLDGPSRSYKHQDRKKFLAAAEYYFMGKKEGVQQYFKAIYPTCPEPSTYLSESLTYREGVLDGPCYIGWHYEIGTVTGYTGTMKSGKEYDGLFVSKLHDSSIQNIFELRNLRNGKLDGELSHIKKGYHCTGDDRTYKVLNYKEGVKHGEFGQWITGGLQTVALNYHEGLLHGKAGLYYEAVPWDGKSRDTEKRRRGICVGQFCHGVPVGIHKLEQNTRGLWMEEISYDSQGQLHGICTYRRRPEFTLECRLNYKHGQLAGRQVIYDLAGHEKFAWTVYSGKGADGKRLKGLVEWFSEGGYVIKSRWIAREEGLTLADIVDEPIGLREPANVTIHLPADKYEVVPSVTPAYSWIGGSEGDEQGQVAMRKRIKVKPCSVADGWTEIRKVEEVLSKEPEEPARGRVWCQMCAMYHGQEQEADEWSEDSYDDWRRDDSDYSDY